MCLCFVRYVYSEQLATTAPISPCHGAIPSAATAAEEAEPDGESEPKEENKPEGESEPEEETEPEGETDPEESKAEEPTEW